VAEIKVSMTYENPNRLFYTCKQQDKCKWFCWCEPIPNESEGQQTIESKVSYAESKISSIEEEVSNLQKELYVASEAMKGLEDELSTMKVESENGLFALKKELDVLLDEFRKHVERDLAAMKDEYGCLYSEVSTLKIQLKEIDKSNRRLKWFMFGIVFLVLWIWICTMK
jgi:chromosome segregation ATPase